MNHGRVEMSRMVGSRTATGFTKKLDNSRGDWIRVVNTSDWVYVDMMQVEVVERLGRDFVHCSELSAVEFDDPGAYVRNSSATGA